MAGFSRRKDVLVWGVVIGAVIFTVIGFLLCVGFVRWMSSWQASVKKPTFVTQYPVVSLGSGVQVLTISGTHLPNGTGFLIQRWLGEAKGETGVTLATIHLMCPIEDLDALFDAIAFQTSLEEKVQLFGVAQMSYCMTRIPDSLPDPIFRFVPTKEQFKIRETLYFGCLIAEMTVGENGEGILTVPQRSEAPLDEWRNALIAEANAQGIAFSTGNTLSLEQFIFGGDPISAYKFLTKAANKIKVQVATTVAWSVAVNA